MAVLLTVGLALVAVTGCQSWVQWGHDAALTNFSPGETTITPANVGGLVPAWTADVPAGDGDLELLAVSSSMVVVGAGGTIVGYSRTGAGCSGAPTTCQPVWRASATGRNFGLAVSGQTLIAVSDSQVAAFDLSGAQGCSGSPAVCTPVWTAASHALGSVTVAGSRAYVQTATRVEVFDATGSTNCSGAPKVCAPVWTSTAVTTVFGTPAVAGGKVFVGGEDGVFAFDANGTANCAGSPVVCSPIWHGAVGGHVRGGPAVSAGSVYVPVYVPVDGTFFHDTGALAVFDATAGATCAGAPVECTPRWTASLAGRVEYSAPAVAHGSVIVGDRVGLHAFDAAGVQGCGGAPLVCSPIWATVPDAQAPGIYQPSVAGDVVFAQGNGTTGAAHRVKAFDAHGSVGCTGTPASCTALFDGALLGGGLDEGAIVVADGVVYGPASTDHITSSTPTLTAFHLP